MRIFHVDRDRLAEWGIEPLSVSEEGTLAKVSGEQLEKLRSDGVALEELGRVVKVNSDDPTFLGNCYGSSDLDNPLECDGGWDPGSIDLSTCKVWSGGEVTWVWHSIDFFTDILQQSGCDDFLVLQPYLSERRSISRARSQNVGLLAPVLPHRRRSRSP